jgi:Uma2 family endonuclease
MAAIPDASMVSVEEYLRSDYEPECEYLDGVVEPKSSSDFEHSRLQQLLCALLGGYEAKFDFLVNPEFRLRIQPGRFRVPDISVLARRPAGSAFADEPPLLTIEILSKDEPLSKLRDKLADHRRMGVRTVLVADPHRREVYTVGADGLLRQLPPPLIVSIDLPGKGDLRIDFDQLFARIG